MSTFCNELSENSVTARPVQIVSPYNHSFHLELQQLKNVLEHNELKDRYVVVVSIAGAFRKGKSFLLNFFLKYLEAQYQKHDTSDWIGERDITNELRGFKWRGGSEPETAGIWIWSEIFTHDFEDGEKVAIILLDTQGIFDRYTTVKECTTIFTLSMLVSSVQCYNLMQDIQENDLHHLNLFTEYGRLMTTDPNGIPFQKLLFIVRDWPYAKETGYGWNGKNKIDTILAGDDEQLPEMRQLRRQIVANFEEISGFLMPYPGKIIAQGESHTGELCQIEAKFVKYVKELVPAIFAPDKLIVKTINKQKIRVGDLMKLFEAYANTFNSNTLPEPKTILMATADASNLILHNSCLNYYIDSIQNAMEKIDPYFTEHMLLALHQNVKAEAIKQFSEKPKLGGDDLASPFLRKLENDTEERFSIFQRENIMKRKSFIEKANLHNDKILNEIQMEAKKRISKAIVNDTNLTLSSMRQTFEGIRAFALEQFDRDKMSNDENSGCHRDKLIRDLDNIGYPLFKTWETFDKCLREYNVLMERSMDGVPSYFTDTELMSLHCKSRQQTLQQFLDEVKSLDVNELAYSFELRIKKEFDMKLVFYEAENKRKQMAHNEACAEQNKILYDHIVETFEDDMRKGIGKSCLDEHQFTALFLQQKLNALRTFGNKKTGDNEKCAKMQRDLEQNIDELRNGFHEFNQSNRSNIIAYVGGVTGGASCGATIGKFFGPEGLVVGAIIGGAAGAVISGVSIFMQKALRLKQK